MNSTWSSPLVPEFTALFSTVWKGEKWWEMLKSKEGEDEHVLWALCCLILYQLSSLSPSKRLNHKRIQSQGDILFSPSLNTLYCILDPHNVLSSCICNSRKQWSGAWFIYWLCVISILNMQFLLTQRTRWVLKWVIRKNSLIFLQQQDQLFTFCGHQQLQRCRISLKHKKIWGHAQKSPILSVDVREGSADVFVHKAGWGKAQ